MERFLIFIKHNIHFLWSAIETVNGFMFNLLYQERLSTILNDVLIEYGKSPLIFRKLDYNDKDSLYDLINRQPADDLKYFHPHGFDMKSIISQIRNRSFLMMGVFDKEYMVGYFFLRFFFNRKCFVGRLIDVSYRNRGIGSIMNDIMYNTSWRMGFKCLSTISKNNVYVMRAHAKNRNLVVLKELKNDFLLIEFKQIY